MSHSQFIPILYPSKPKALLIDIFFKDGRIHSINTTINSVLVEFSKDVDGNFKTTTVNQIEKPYLAYITEQLNRMFGN